MVTRCSSCGPGYHYGDDGCRHAPSRRDRHDVSPQFTAGEDILAGAIVGTDPATGQLFMVGRIESNAEAEQAAMADVCEVAARLGRDRDALQAAVNRARRVGVKWRVIGDALGITKQSAHERFGKGGA